MSIKSFSKDGYLKLHPLKEFLFAFYKTKPILVKIEFNGQVNLY